MKCAAYIVGKRLCVVGVENTPMGPVPLAAYADLDKDTEEGVIDLDDVENIPDHVKEALGKTAADMNDTLNFSQLQASVASTVSRAREGDQNAMAILSLMGERAREGHPRASMVAKAVQEYIRSHPYKQLTIGSESSNVKNEFEDSPVLRAIAREAEGPGYALALAVQLPSAPRTMSTVLTLAHGPALTRELLIEIAEGMEDNEEGISQVFLSGVDRSHDDSGVFAQARMLPEERSAVLLAGRLVGMARTIQAVHIGQWPEKAISKNVAWELGL